MIEIREVDGRFEVFCEDWHWEAFEGALGAQQAATSLASNIFGETGTRPAIMTPWGDLSVVAQDSVGYMGECDDRDSATLA